MVSLLIVGHGRDKAYQAVQEHFHLGYILSGEHDVICKYGIIVVFYVPF